jgi:hypothetical protein
MTREGRSEAVRGADAVTNRRSHSDFPSSLVLSISLVVEHRRRTGVTERWLGETTVLEQSYVGTAMGPSSSATRAS